MPEKCRDHMFMFTMRSLPDELLRVSIAQLAQNVGWDAVGSSTFDVLADVCTEFIRQISRASKSFAEHRGHNRPTLNDSVLALEHLHIALDSLIDYVHQYPSLQFVARVPTQLASASFGCYRADWPSEAEIDARTDPYESWMPSLDTRSPAEKLQDNSNAESESKPNLDSSGSASLDPLVSLTQVYDYFESFPRNDERPPTSMSESLRTRLDELNIDGYTELNALEPKYIYMNADGQVLSYGGKPGKLPTCEMPSSALLTTHQSKKATTKHETSRRWPLQQSIERSRTVKLESSESTRVSKLNFDNAKLKTNLISKQVKSTKAMFKSSSSVVVAKKIKKKADLNKMNSMKRARSLNRAGPPPKVLVKHEPTKRTESKSDPAKNKLSASKPKVAKKFKAKKPDVVEQQKSSTVVDEKNKQLDSSAAINSSNLVAIDQLCTTVSKSGEEDLALVGKSPKESSAFLTEDVVNKVKDVTNTLKPPLLEIKAAKLSQNKPIESRPFAEKGQIRTGSGRVVIKPKKLLSNQEITDFNNNDLLFQPDVPTVRSKIVKTTPNIVGPPMDSAPYIVPTSFDTLSAITTTTSKITKKPMQECSAPTTESIDSNLETNREPKIIPKLRFKISNGIFVAAPSEPKETKESERGDDDGDHQDHHHHHHRHSKSNGVKPMKTESKESRRSRKHKKENLNGGCVLITETVGTFTQKVWICPQCHSADDGTPMIGQERKTNKIYCCNFLIDSRTTFFLFFASDRMRQM